jgi:hypothetical protein
MYTALRATSQTLAAYIQQRLEADPNLAPFFFKVGHNAFEFVLDFGQFYPENAGAQFHTRIISNPVYTKALLHTLGESIEQYEQTFGAIPGETE